MGKVTPDDMVNEDAPCQILSIKLSMTVLVILLSLGIVAVAVMFSTVNIVSLIGMKGNGINPLSFTTTKRKYIYRKARRFQSVFNDSCK